MAAKTVFRVKLFPHAKRQESDHSGLCSGFLARKDYALGATSNQGGLSCMSVKNAMDAVSQFVVFSGAIPATLAASASLFIVYAGGTLPPSFQAINVQLCCCNAVVFRTRRTCLWWRGKCAQLKKWKAHLAGKCLRDSKRAEIVANEIKFYASQASAPNDKSIGQLQLEHYMTVSRTRLHAAQ